MEGNLEHFSYTMLFSALKAGIVNNFMETYGKWSIRKWKSF